MMYEKLIAAIYAEEDFGRSVATALAGVTGLVAYLIGSDWVIALFVAVIIFPLMRLSSTALHARWKNEHAEALRRLRAEKELNRLSPEERQVIEFFVRAGGACVSWEAVNRSTFPFPREAVNSLIERGVVRTTVMEDGMTEAFALDIDTFDAAQRVFRASKSAEPAGSGALPVAPGAPAGLSTSAIREGKRH